MSHRNLILERWHDDSCHGWRRFYWLKLSLGTKSSEDGPISWLWTGWSQRNIKILNALEIADFIDLDDFLDVFDEVGPIGAVFHRGACSDTTATDGEYIYRNNLAYSQSLAALAASQSIPFIYASSASVYGHGINGFREERSCEDPSICMRLRSFFLIIG